MKVLGVNELIKMKLILNICIIIFRIWFNGDSKTGFLTDVTNEYTTVLTSRVILSSLESYFNQNDR